MCSFGFFRSSVWKALSTSILFILKPIWLYQFSELFYGFLLFFGKYPNVLTWPSRRPLVVWPLLILPASSHSICQSSSIWDPGHHTYFSLLTSCFPLLLCLCKYCSFSLKHSFSLLHSLFSHLPLFSQMLLIFQFPAYIHFLQEICDAFSMWFIKLKF